jgi:DNA-binding NarL/FixJ family response regulator
MRILLADDHPLLRESVRRLLEGQPDFHVVAEAGSGPEAVELAGLHHPDAAVVGLGMKEAKGLEITSELLRRSPATSVLLLGMYSDERYVTRSFAAGAHAYVLKDSLETELVEAIRVVGAGGKFFSPGITTGFTPPRSAGRR